MRDYTAMLLKSGKEPKQADRAWTIRWVFQSMVEYMDLMEKMRWRLLSAPPGRMFITCDNPVFFFDPHFKPARNAEGVKWSTSTLFMFPLSRSFTLCGEVAEGQDLAAEATEIELRRFTTTMVARGLTQVYSPFRDSVLRDLVDKVHTERQPILQNIPDPFFHEQFDKFTKA